MLLYDGLLVSFKLFDAEDDSNLRSARDVINMVAQGNKQVEEELSIAVEHLELHSAATLESAAAADDEGEVMGPELGVGVGSVGVGVASRGQDGAGLNAGLCFSWSAKLGAERNNSKESTYGDPACAERCASVPPGRTCQRHSRWPCPSVARPRRCGGRRLPRTGHPRQPAPVPMSSSSCCAPAAGSSRPCRETRESMRRLRVLRQEARSSWFASQSTGS